MVDDGQTPEAALAAPEGVFVHARALCESRQVGPGSRVWAFAHILPGARLGADCNVCDHVFIENDVVVGDRVNLEVDLIARYVERMLHGQDGDLLRRG